MKLSILICSLQNRSAFRYKLLSHLEKQAKGSNHIEILVYTDNKELSTGAKRQHLLEQAKGDYIVFIDDDDWVPHYYVKEFLRAIQSKADCIAINGTMCTDGGKPVKWAISKNFDNTDIVKDGETLLVRTTNHITAVKRSLALQAGFPDKSNAEDKHYSDRLRPLLKTEFILELPMYEYRFSTKNKEYK